MEYNKERLLNLARGVSWYLDYTSYILFNPYKFKSIPIDVKRILIIENKFIGDIIVLTPAIHALREKYPTAVIDIVVPDIMKELLRNDTAIDNILFWDKLPYVERLDIIKNKYDLAVIFHTGTPEICKLLKDANVKFRIGCTRAGITESKGHSLHRMTRPTFKLKQKIEDNLDVLKLININNIDKKLILRTDKESDIIIKDMLYSVHGISPNEFIVAIHPVPQHKTHEWSKEKFADLADRLIDYYKARIIFTGSDKDKHYINEIKKLMKHDSINMAGTSLQEFISLINQVKLVISVDTSAMHVAAALDRTVISLFGAGNPKIWAPYCNKSMVIFNDWKVHTSCMKHQCYLKGDRHMECMNAIKVDDILKLVTPNYE